MVQLPNYSTISIPIYWQLINTRAYRRECTESLCTSAPALQLDNGAGRRSCASPCLLAAVGAAAPAAAAAAVDAITGSPGIDPRALVEVWLRTCRWGCPSASHPHLTIISGVPFGHCDPGFHVVHRWLRHHSLRSLPCHCRHLALLTRILAITTLRRQFHYDGRVDEAHRLVQLVFGEAFGAGGVYALQPCITAVQQAGRGSKAAAGPRLMVCR